MRAESEKFFTQLLQTPSPSGFEQPAQRLIRKRMRAFADEIFTDVHGNTVVAINPQAKPRVMLAGHVDQIGFMVRYISDDGFVHFAPIGGIDSSVVPGLVLTIHASKGAIPGVVGRKAIHLMKPEEKKNAAIELKDLWLDIGCKSKKEVEKHVEVGDPITYQLGVTRLDNNLRASPGMDDKVGAFAVMEAVRLIRACGRHCPCAVFAVSTVQEELGMRGARTSCFSIDPQVGIAVDVTHAADYPGSEKKTVGDISVGKGPVISIGPNINPVLGKLLLDTAQKKKIPFQREGESSATGTDANAIQITRAGVAAALVSVPNRYMHTPVEIVSLSDLEDVARLLFETCMQIGPKMDFIPK